MILNKDEFDLNYKDVDFDCCIHCGTEFGSFDTYYYFKSVMDCSESIICPDCTLKLYHELHKILGGNENE